MGPLLETPPTDAGDTGDPATVITLLGEFSLRREERTLDVPSGNVARLLKLLAIADEARSIDYVIDQLWPDTTSDIGRRRLKNVLTRIRKVSETLVERSPETLQLGAAVGSDLRLFRDAAHRAIAGAAPHRLSLCVEALNLYTGPLLPTDQYDDEISIERVQVDALAASVFELLLNSMEIGRLSPAWVLETANRIAIESDQVYVRIAEMAVDSGAEVCATSALARAAAIADSLDVPLLTDSRLEHLLPKT